MVSFRRYYLDAFLAEIPFFGNVLDVGGERATARGEFRAPLHKVQKWIFLNPDPSTKPDIVGSAENLAVDDNWADFIKITEVLEHLQNPERVLQECHRVLKSGGQLIGSIPFLYPVHGDPDDFTRWTKSGIEELFKRARFSKIEVAPMGGFWATLADIFEFRCSLEFTAKGKLSLRNRIFRIVARRILLGYLMKLDKKDPYKNKINTGYFIIAFK